MTTSGFTPPLPPKGSGGVGSMRSNRPSDYEIRRDALSLTVAMTRDNQCMTPATFHEWLETFEQSLRQTL